MADDDSVLEPDASPLDQEPVSDVEAPEPLPRCDCPALDVPHVHEQGGPAPLTEA